MNQLHGPNEIGWKTLWMGRAIGTLHPTTRLYTDRISSPIRMDDPEPEDVFDLMADDYAREILAHTSRQPMSAKDLVEACGVSERTVYRRLEQLQSFGLVRENLQLDPQGHHRKLYEATLQTVVIELDNGEYDIRLQIEEDAADRFARMWKDIRGET